ncbi:GIY-YIG nuclease family protein [Fusobacterium sp.]|uniref:GIY-YIG nuclease family protein n=1 Tax=Fusobacterium sp. TaxID=68766 RepID=UPI002623E139|nr:GIY-YIG nuclease family protein [Fusobacterium sp.]
MNNNIKKPWFLYMIRCEDNSIYTGITTDIERRYKEHREGKGAKYTRIRKPKEICCFFQLENRSSAGRLECFIKKLSKKEKEFLIFDEKNKKNFLELAEKELKIKINL